MALTWKRLSKRKISSKPTKNVSNDVSSEHTGYQVNTVYTDKEHVVFSCNTQKDCFGNVFDTTVKSFTNEGYFVCVVFK